MMLKIPTISTTPIMLKTLAIINEVPA